MNNLQDISDIQQFYKDTTVFVSGATGFIGKLVLEKILRALPVKKIFVLVRKKPDASSSERLQHIFESPAFDIVKQKNKGALEKVFVMEGDCSFPMLGLSEEDQRTLINEVNVVFHVAASINFNEKIKKSTLTNVRATRDMIILAQQALHLKTFVYVGTAYSNSPKQEIKEEIYQTSISAENLITACEVLEDSCLDSMTKTLIGESPNTYTFGKQVTEDYISRKARNIPICIIRPALVMATLSEPVPGFIDNIFSVNGYILANSSGVNRMVYYKKINLPIVPADIVVNACIAAGWQTGESFKLYGSEVPVYHVSSCVDNPITLDQLLDETDSNMRQVPSKKLLVLYPLFFRTTCRYNYFFWRMIFNTGIAYLLDFILGLQGKKRMFTKAVAKLHKLHDSYEFFVSYSVFFHSDNIGKMLRKMSSKDRKLFNLDIAEINWKTYFIDYAKGILVYLLKDSVTTLPEGQQHYNYLRNVFIGIILAVICFTIYMVFFLLNFFF